MARLPVLPLFVVLTVLPVAARPWSPAAATAEDVGTFPAARSHRTRSGSVSPFVHAIVTGAGARPIVLERA